jgi:hypothetical protein
MPVRAASGHRGDARIALKRANRAAGRSSVWNRPALASIACLQMLHRRYLILQAEDCESR